MARAGEGQRVRRLTPHPRLAPSGIRHPLPAGAGERESPRGNACNCIISVLEQKGNTGAAARQLLWKA